METVTSSLKGSHGFKRFHRDGYGTVFDHPNSKQYSKSGIKVCLYLVWHPSLEGGGVKRACEHLQISVQNHLGPGVCAETTTTISGYRSDVPLPGSLSVPGHPYGIARQYKFLDTVDCFPTGFPADNDDRTNFLFIFNHRVVFSNSFHNWG